MARAASVALVASGALEASGALVVSAVPSAAAARAGTGARTPRVRPTAARATINLQDPWVTSPATALPCAPPALPHASLEDPHRPAPTTAAAQAWTSVATTPVWARRCANHPGAPEDLDHLDKLEDFNNLEDSLDKFVV